MRQRVSMRDMIFGAAIMLVGMGCASMFSSPFAQRNGVFDEIQCTRLTVVDKQGKEAVILGADENWGNGAGIIDKQGKMAASLGVDEEWGNHVAVHGKQGDVTVALTVDEEKGTGLTVYDDHGKKGLGLSSD